MNQTKKIKKKRNPIFLILIILILGLIGFQVLNMKNPKDKNNLKGLSKEESDTAFAITAANISSGQLINYIDVNGEVIAASTVDVFSDAAGKLTHLYVEIGDYVRKNEIIAKVDPSKPGMSYAPNPVKSTISGTVTSLPKDIGATVNPQVPIATVGNLSALQVQTYISERYISLIKKGMKAEVNLESYPGETFEARVSEISPVVDPISRTLKIKMDLIDKKSPARAGMYAKIKLITEVKKDIIKIPSDAIVNRFGETFVFVISDNNRVKKQIIVPGISIDSITEIREGLSAKDKIVYQGQTLLEDGSLVKVVRTVSPLQ